MARRIRSPQYPFIDLKGAIAKTQQFYEQENRNQANVSVAARHWGYAPKSSGVAQTVAALVAFGLMQDSGSGDTRTVEVTPLARKILLDTREESTDRAKALQEAALKPSIHEQLIEKYPDGLPSDENLRHELLLNWNPAFNDKVVDGFIRRLRSTLEFAGLTNLDTLSRQDADRERVTADSTPPDCATTGVDPASHDGEPLPESAPSGESVNEAAVVNVNVNSRRDIFSLPEGEVTVQWPSPLGSDSIKDLEDWLDLLKRKIGRSRSIGS